MELSRDFGARARPLRKALVMLMGCLLLGVALAPRCQAQTWAEWFKQKKTQKKYLLTQIAALQVYLDYARKGYQLVGSGLETVRQLSSGEFSLHHTFITGLAKVSPAIRDDLRVAEVVALQVSIMRQLGSLKSNPGLSADQLLYVAEVSAGLISDCYHELEELVLIVTAGKLELSDDQRLERLAGVHARMLDKAAFAREFCAETGMLIRQREMEQHGLDKLRRYYELE